MNSWTEKSDGDGVRGVVQLLKLVEVAGDVEAAEVAMEGLAFVFQPLEKGFYVTAVGEDGLRTFAVCLQRLDERSDDVFGVYGHVRNSFLERWSYDLLASNMVKCKKPPEDFCVLRGRVLVAEY